MNRLTVIKNIFVDMLGVEESDLVNDASHNDLGMDSLDKVDVIMELERTFNINISDPEFDELKQFSDYVAIVERKVNND